MTSKKIEQETTAKMEQEIAAAVQESNEEYKSSVRSKLMLAIQIPLWVLIVGDALNGIHKYTESDNFVPNVASGTLIASLLYLCKQSEDAFKKERENGKIQKVLANHGCQLRDEQYDKNEKKRNKYSLLSSLAALSCIFGGNDSYPIFPLVCLGVAVILMNGARNRVASNNILLNEHAKRVANRYRVE